MDKQFLESHDIDVAALIASARWFSNLGHAIASTGVIVVKPDQWQAVVRVANAGGFGESPDPADQAAIPDFEWLDDELEQTE